MRTYVVYWLNKDKLNIVYILFIRNLIFEYINSNWIEIFPVSVSFIPLWSFTPDTAWYQVKQCENHEQKWFLVNSTLFRILCIVVSTNYQLSMQSISYSLINISKYVRFMTSWNVLTLWHRERIRNSSGPFNFIIVNNCNRIMHMKRNMNWNQFCIHYDIH